MCLKIVFFWLKIGKFHSTLTETAAILGSIHVPWFAGVGCTDQTKIF